MIDKANLYNSYFEKVKTIIKKLKEININTDVYEEALNNIEIYVKLNLELNEKKELNTSVFKEETLINIYSKGIERLNILDDELQKEYSKYYFINNINTIINNNKDKILENLDKYINYAVKLLNLMETSSTVNYDVEKKLFTEAYDNVYLILLYESLFSKDNILLNTIINSTSHTNYINAKLLNDLDKIKDEKVLDEAIKLNAYNLLSKDIISVIASDNNKIDNVVLKESLNDIISNINEYIIKIEESESKINSINKKKKISKGKALLCTIPVVALIAVNVLAATKGTHKEYYTTEIEVNIDTNEEVSKTNSYTHEDELKTKDEIYVKTPWDKLDEYNVYIRDITKYVLITNDNKDIARWKEENDNINDSELKILAKTGYTSKKIDTDTERKLELTDEDNYNNNLYIYHKYIYDKDNYIKEKGINDDTIALLFISDFIILISYLTAVTAQLDFLQYDKIAKNKELEDIEIKLRIYKKRLNELISTLENKINTKYIYNQEEKELALKLIKEYKSE